VGRDGRELGASHPLPFDVEVHQLPSGYQVVLDTHRLLIPDMAWIDWMMSSAEARPWVWAVRVRPEDGTVCTEQWSVRARLKWDATPAWTRELQRVLLASLPRGEWTRVASVRMLSRHREAGIVLLQGMHSTGAPACTFVVSCPEWYFGNSPLLTCLLPAEASTVLRERVLPQVAPDCTLQGSDGSEVSSRELLHASSQLADHDSLWQAAAALLPHVAEVEAADDAARDGGTASSTSSSASILALRHAAKQVLHTRGLALRHIGMVHRTAVASGDPRYASAGWHRLVLAVALPRRVSPAGAALLGCIKEALAAPSVAIAAEYDMVAEAAITCACLEARCFAAKGVQMASSCHVEAWLDRAVNPAPTVAAKGSSVGGSGPAGDGAGSGMPAISSGDQGVSAEPCPALPRDDAPTSMAGEGDGSAGNRAGDTIDQGDNTGVPADPSARVVQDVPASVAPDLCADPQTVALVRRSVAQILREISCV